jgi:hypothetical protein
MHTREGEHQRTVFSLSLTEPVNDERDAWISLWYKMRPLTRSREFDRLQGCIPPEAFDFLIFLRCSLIELWEQVSIAHVNQDAQVSTTGT